MKKSTFIFFSAVICLLCIAIVGFKTPLVNQKITLAATGTLYIKIKNDKNKGNINISVRAAESMNTLLDVDLPPGQIIEKTFSNLPAGPQKWYLISLAWDPSDFHNISETTGNIIAYGFPVTADNILFSWQIAGKGAFGSIPVQLPFK